MDTEPLDLSVTGRASSDLEIQECRQERVELEAAASACEKSEPNSFGNNSWRFVPEHCVSYPPD